MMDGAATPEEILLAQGGGIEKSRPAAASNEADDDPYADLVPETEQQTREEKEWEKYLQHDDRGQPVANLANAALVLRRDEDMRNLLCYDEMLRHTILLRKVPKSKGGSAIYPRPMQDADVSAVQEWLQRNKLRRLGRETAQQAIEMVAGERSTHPVRDYLKSLKWDNAKRLDTFLPIYFGTESTPYTRSIGRWFLIAMVARIMRPGCKCDYMLVLEGEQGARKSSACAILAGKWFSDSLPDLHRNDGVRLSMHLRGKWVVEVAELSSIGKAEAGALKAFLTQTEERYLPKYGRNEVIEPRQCVFIGTTNKAAYLRDETGGRRFWPVKVGRVDTDALQRDRDQLFAEAATAFRRGDRWWPDTAFEKEHIKPQQELRFEDDAWETAIADWLFAQNKCTVAEVARSALGFQTSRISTSDQRRITFALERLGWRQGKRGHGGVRWWVRREDG